MDLHPSTTSQAYPGFHVRRSADYNGIDFYDSEEGTLIDADGTIVFETDHRGLLLAIVKRNDVKSLKRYLAKHPYSLGPGVTESYDPYWVAADKGSTEVLRVLLDHYTDAVESLDKRGYLLLNVACQAAQLETARFLLDNSQYWSQAGVTVDISAEDYHGMTALLSAASAFTDIPSNEEGGRENYTNLSLPVYVARTENVMDLLLDRGAHAGDTCTFTSCEANVETQIRHSVLSLAISRASARLVSRLLATGAAQADALKTMHSFMDVSREKRSHNVTPLHIGALYCNFEGIQVLLEYDNNMIKIADSNGHLPLHWAAVGPGYEDYMLSKDDIVPHVIETTRLLLAHDPDAVNIPDSQGRTALFYACVPTYKEPQQVIRNATLLLEKGADGGYRDADGKTPLHFLLRQSNAISEPELLELMATLLRCGADVGAADAEQDTPLHLAARNLGHIQIAKFLLRHGASASAPNATGSTPLHEAARGYVVIATPSSSDLYEEQQQQQLMLTADIRIKMQDKMMDVLLDAVADVDDLMDRPDAAGRTPRLICDAKRSEWRAADEERIIARSGIGSRGGWGRGWGN